jgi:adhesin/invasin
VTINSILLPLLYVGPSQINAQAPFELSPGPVQLTVTSNGIVLSPITVQIAATSPGVFQFLNGSGHAAVENQDYSLNTTQNPAKPGAYLFAFMTGQGLVNPAVADGAPAPLSPLSYAVAPITATIGGQQAFVEFAGLAPTLAGVSQLNIVVPNLPPGDYPLVISAGGVLSNSATVSIGP